MPIHVDRWQCSFNDIVAMVLQVHDRVRELNSDANASLNKKNIDGLGYLQTEGVPVATAITALSELMKGN